MQLVRVIEPTTIYSVAGRSMHAMIPEGRRACRGFAAAVADLLNLNRPQRRRRPARRKRRGCLVGEMASWVWSHVADGIKDGDAQVCSRNDDREAGLSHCHLTRRSRVYVAQSIKYSNATQPASYTGG
jgi:hypothetical protein